MTSSRRPSRGDRRNRISIRYELIEEAGMMNVFITCGINLIMTFTLYFDERSELETWHMSLQRDEMTIHRINNVSATNEFIIDASRTNGEQIERIINNDIN